MRRARIKAVATVPVRRKVAQETTKPELTDENIDKATELPTTNEDLDINGEVGKSDSTLPEISQKEPEKENVEVTTQSICEKVATKTQSIQEQEAVLPSENTVTNEIASPAKSVQSRSCFMRPIPRFDNGGRIRRNSVQGSGASASESEDDSKRTASINANRIRNDSICSVQSNKDTGSINNSQNNVIKLKAGQKRRMVVSESARKLAEARREFHLKHENKVPDRSKLTMYDLIYYNPVTKPMKKAREDVQVQRKISEVQSMEQHEENEDDPSPMPVPQVKVGPDGQLIIDEQSLVIEQTDAKRSREILSKEAIVDEDNNGSGFYKRRQKSKEWPKWETLKFYKALNTVGTDFLLMQSLFPNRTRQEIKLKYKKEEKVNRRLIEKALTYHQEFDIDMLQKDLATFEETEKGQEKRKQSEAKDRKRTVRMKRRARRIVASSIQEMDATEDEDEPGSPMITETTDTFSAVVNNQEQQNINIVQNNKRAVHSGVCEIAQTEVAPDNESDSDTEFYRVRPTRSGRVPKVKRLQGPSVNTLDNTSDCNTMDYESVNSSDEDESSGRTSNTVNEIQMNPPSHSQEIINAALPDIGKVEAGSLVILSKESPEEPGKTVLQVYMVSSNVNSAEEVKQNITPVDLSPELLATVTTKLANSESVDVKDEYE